MGQALGSDFLRISPFEPHTRPLRSCYHLHFTDEETEAQRGEVTCLRSPSWEGAELEFQ